MASLAAFPQFGANPVVDRVLGVDKSLQVVWIAHPISPTEGVSTVMVESRGTRMCDVVFRFARDSPLEEVGFELSVPRDTTKVLRPPHSPLPDIPATR
jgi:hypothetical protein